MTVKEAIEKRQSPKGFIDKAIEEEKYQILFKAFQSAPSSYNEQPWRLVVIKKVDNNFFQLNKTLADANQQWADSAVAFMVVCAKKTLTKTGAENFHSRYDTGMAAMSLLLQATELSLYARQMGGFDRQAATNLLKLTNDFEIMSVMAIGYSELENNTPRKELKEIIHNNDWNS